jgi:hypothetical protein
MIVIKNVENAGTGLGISGMLSMSGTGGSPLICSHSRKLISALLSSILYCSRERVIHILLSDGDVFIMDKICVVDKIIYDYFATQPEIGFFRWD